MTARPAPVGRLVPVRLTDLKPAVLQRGKSVVLKHETDFHVKLAVGAIAENPSRKVYWIPERAWRRVLDEEGFR